MLRIGILDDETQARDRLSFSLYRLLHKEENDLKIIEFSKGEELVSWLSKQEGQMDLCFLDIEMEGISGMEAARRIRTFNEEVVFIFLTGYQDYVFDGYSVGAVGYLLKPFTEKKLKETVDRALNRLFRQEQNIFTVTNKEGMFRLPFVKISYFYSSGRKVIAVTKKREYVFYDKISNVEEKVGDDYIRIHQRYLIRADQVESVEGESLVICGKRLPISRSYQKQVLMAFMKAML